MAASSLLFTLLSVGIAWSAPPSGCITGVIISAESGEPINWSTVSILELDRSEPSHHGGTFTFCQVPKGSYTIAVEHVGYRTVHLSVSTSRGDTAFLNIVMQPTPLQMEEVVVKAKRSQNGLERTGSTQLLSGAKLQQQLGGTLAETIENEPGIAKQSMGPASARPVIRGLGGDRLVILEDGSETGDASAISTDHAVTADLMTAERIEILRGPASFLYSSNALGGIINIEREKTIANRPDQVHGTVSVQGNSVDAGYSLGTSLGIPAGPLGLQLQLSYRNTQDISTPEGSLINTDIETFDGSTGLNWLFSRGSIGIKAGYYDSRYGIPGGFTGAHPEGVRIEMDRREMGGTFDYHIPDHFVKRIKADVGYTRYHHKELETETIIGTEYGILTSTASIRADHSPVANLFDRGVISIQGSIRDFAASGTGIPRNDERSLGISLFEEKKISSFLLSGALRFDVNTIIPDEEDSSEVGIIAEQSFSDFSGAISASWNATDQFLLGLSAARSFRTPTPEELFSDGPHLAAYSYEIGNSTLEPETGISLEGFIKYTSETALLELSVYRNAFDNYVFARATGDTNFRTRLPLYQYSGEEALFTGGELTFEWQFLEHLVGKGVMSYVRGARTESGNSLPFIPPLQGSLGLRWHSTLFFAGLTARMATAQDQVGEFEEPTDGYIALDATAQYRIITESLLHTFILGFDNVLNTTYRNHLSRTKAIMPEPGRSVRVLYRLYF